MVFARSKWLAVLMLSGCAAINPDWIDPAGSGTELRELRELRPGDPFKSIAWKASARSGKLLVREVESVLADAVLRGRIRAGSDTTVTRDRGKFTLS